MTGRLLVTVVLVVCLAGSGVGAETLKEAAAREADSAAAQIAQSSGGGGGLKWAGIALLGGGGAYLFWATQTETDGTTCSLGTCVDNESIRTGRYIIGGALAGTGAFLLAKGISKGRKSSPSVIVVPKGVVLGQRIAF